MLVKNIKEGSCCGCCRGEVDEKVRSLIARGKLLGGHTHTSKGGEQATRIDSNLIDKSSSQSRRDIKVFVSTYNLAEKTLDELGDLKKWLLPGYDLYAIGFQECMCLDKIRAKMLQIIGGEDEFCMYVMLRANEPFEHPQGQPHRPLNTP